MILLLTLPLFVVAAIFIALSFDDKIIYHILYLLSGIVVLVAALGVVAAYLNYSPTQIQTPVVATNTIYQNSNYSSIQLYATGNNIFAYLSNNSSTLQEVAEGNSIALKIPEAWYFKLNYTAANVIEVTTK